MSLVQRIRNNHQEIDFLALRDISKFRVCNFNLVEKGRPFRNIWNTLYVLVEYYSVNLVQQVYFEILFKIVVNEQNILSIME